MVQALGVPVGVLGTCEGGCVIATRTWDSSVVTATSSGNKLLQDDLGPSLNEYCSLRYTHITNRLYLIVL